MRKVSGIHEAQNPRDRFFVSVGVFCVLVLGTVLRLDGLAAQHSWGKHSGILFVWSRSAVLCGFSGHLGEISEEAPRQSRTASLRQSQRCRGATRQRNGGQVEELGPFRFTASLLVYDSGHEFQLVPYDQIARAEIEKPESDEPTAVVVHTRSGRRYQWYRTWMQGIFDPEQVVAKIRAAARLDKPAEENR